MESTTKSWRTNTLPNLLPSEMNPPLALAITSAPRSSLRRLAVMSKRKSAKQSHRRRDFWLASLSAFSEQWATSRDFSSKDLRWAS